MSESVEILIKADDQASQEFGAVAANMDKSMKRVNQILAGLEDPAERYARQLEELNQLHKSGAIDADKFAAASAKIQEKLAGTGNAFKEVGGKAKSATEFVGTLAAMTGNSQISGFASQIAGMTEKVGQFSEVSKSGKAGALAFKLGLIGLAVTIGATIGKALGDIIFETKKFNREFERAKQASKDFEDQIRKTASAAMDMRKADIELIRDPEKKKAEYQKMLDQLNKDIQGVSGQLEQSIKLSDEWDDSWKITGNQKAYAEQAKEQVEIDKQRLAALKEQRDEVARLTSARVEAQAALAEENKAKDNSAEYIEKLKEEIEYLAATKEEQLKLDAARNTTLEDRGEAEKLLKERDAIMAKLEAEEKLRDEQQKARDEAEKAAEKAKEHAEQEAQKVEDLVKSERERLELRRIEIEQGKEAARAQALINQGVDEATAKQLAADEAALENKQPKEAKNLQAAESRLITRGDASNPMDKTNRILEQTQRQTAELAKYNAEQLETQRRIAENTAKSTKMVATT